MLDIVKKGKSVWEVAYAVRDLLPSEIRATIVRLSEDDRELMEVWTLRLGKAGNNRRLIERGFLLFAADILDELRGNGRELYERLRIEFNISPSTAHSDKQVYLAMGRVFLESPNLLELLPQQSLRLLSKSHVSSQARSEAVALLREGKLIPSKLAEQLIRDFSVTATADEDLQSEWHEPEEVLTGPTSEVPAYEEDDTLSEIVSIDDKPQRAKVASFDRRKFVFEGKSSTVVVKPRGRQRPDTADIAEDLRAALDQLSEEVDLANRTHLADEERGNVA